MNIFDVITTIIPLYGLIKGFIKGFVVEVAGLISLVLGVMGAFKFADIFGIYLSPYFDLDPKIIQTGGFILLFIIIIYTISLLAKMITKTLKVVALGMINTKILIKKILKNKLADIVAISRRFINEPRWLIETNTRPTVIKKTSIPKQYLRCF